MGGLAAAVPATLIAAMASAALPTGAVAQADPGTTVFDTRSVAAYGDLTPALRAYLARASPRPRGPQHFCAIGYVHPEGGRAAWVHWREGRRLIRWRGSADPAHAADALLRSNRDLDLRTDVVATDAESAGSTYLVTRAWADRVIAECGTAGASYAVPPSMPRQER